MVGGRVGKEEKEGMNLNDYKEENYKIYSVIFILWRILFRS